MPSFEITSPDGRRFQINAPEGASQDDVLAYAQSNMPAASHAPTFDPTEGMSGLDRAMAGVGKAVADTGRGLRQLASYVGIGDPNAVQREIDEAKRLDAPLMNTGAGVAGNIGGQIATTLLPGGALARAGKAAAALPGLARAGQAIEGAGQALTLPKTAGQAGMAGGVFGGMQPVSSDDSRLGNMAFGAAGGALGNALPRAVGRALNPQISDDVRTLMAAGVTPTPGQIMGGATQRIEDGLTSLPILGDAIKGARNRALGQFNQAAYNRALGPLGQKVPEGVIGNEAVEHVSETLSKAYDDLLPKLNVQVDGQFGQDLGQLRQAAQNLPDNYRDRYGALLQRLVLNKFDDAGAMTGKTMKQVESQLGSFARQYAKSGDPEQRMFGQTLQQTQAALRDLAHRSNPEYAEILGDINQGWANLVRINHAAASTGAPNGVFTAAQLRSAAKANDSSLRKSSFAKGNALMQDLADAGANVLGSKVPDSGTPYRLWTNLGAAGGLGYFSPTALATGLAASGLYTQPMQKIVASAMTKRPESFGLSGDLAAKGSPLLGVPGAIGLLNLK